MANRRRGATVAVVILISTVFVAGWFLAQTFQSPSQREASATPPAAQPVFTKVRQGDLVASAQGRGTVAAAEREDVTPVADPANAVVTAVYRHAGEPVVNGDALVAVNGAPAFLVSSPFPFYRDMGPGTSGPDVNQLQRALVSRGLAVADAERTSQTYGVTTTASVARLLAGAAGAGTPSGTLSLSQIVSVPKLPARVSSVYGIGKQVTPGTPIGVLEHGNLQIHAKFLTSDAAAMRPGMSAVFDVGGGTQIKAQVVAVASGAAPAGQDPAASAAQQEQAEVTLAGLNALSVNLQGRSGLVTVTLDVVAQQALIVPSRAVAYRTGGRSQVMRRTPNGLEAVDVTVLGTLDASVAVHADKDETLTAADYVQVG